MSETELQRGVRSLLHDIKRDSFTAGYTASDEEAMGLLVSKFFEWDGVAIARTAEYALEDANFHTESGILGDMAGRLEAGIEP